MKSVVIFLLVMMCVVSVNAQQRSQKWYVAPSVDFASFTDGDAVFDAGLTFGRYLGFERGVRIDLCGDHYFLNRDVRIVSTSLLATAESDIFGSRRFFSTSSAGVGVLFPVSSGNVTESDFFDVLIPLRLGVGYRFPKFLSIGTEMSMSFNLGNFKARSIFSTGIFLGVQF
ncbi:MAG: hypothetical protein LBR65_06015 [Culturomica sp.]|jgi:hypothetical protein|nr:hypothetical protein [Culturomica sp.]